jgi:HSP20 family molecular chaperone IbpA
VARRRKRDSTPKIIKHLHKGVRGLHKGYKELRKAMLPYEEPYCEISHNPQHMRIHIKMPDVLKHTIHLKIHTKKVEIQGIQKKKNKGYYKVVDIPTRVDTGRLRAVYSGGSLKMKLPYVHP